MVFCCWYQCMRHKQVHFSSSWRFRCKTCCCCYLCFLNPMNNYSSSLVVHWNQQLSNGVIHLLFPDEGWCRLPCLVGWRSLDPAVTSCTSLRMEIGLYNASAQIPPVRIFEKIRPWAKWFFFFDKLHDPSPPAQCLFVMQYCYVGNFITVMLDACNHHQQIYIMKIDEPSVLWITHVRLHLCVPNKVSPCMLNCQKMIYLCSNDW